jgi:hypothetical protein
MKKEENYCCEKCFKDKYIRDYIRRKKQKENVVYVEEKMFML